MGLTFFPNGTYSQFIVTPGGLGNETGYWQIQDDRLLSKPVASTIAPASIGTIETIFIVQLDDRVLSVRAKDQQVYTFQRFVSPSNVAQVPVVPDGAFQAQPIQPSPLTQNPYVARLQQMSVQELMMEKFRLHQQSYSARGAAYAEVQAMENLVLQMIAARQQQSPGYPSSGSSTHTTPWQEEKYKDHLKHLGHAYRLQQGVKEPVK